MMRANDALSAERGRYWSRKSRFNDPEANMGVELGMLFEVPNKANSDLSMDSLESVSDNPTIPAVHQLHQSYRPLLLHLDLGDRTVTKQLDYETFARWDAMAGLMADLEKDGMAISNPWDVEEEMEVRSGDWNARVRHGWAIKLSCQYTSEYSQETDSDDGSDRDDDYGRVEDIYREYRYTKEEIEDWCLPRWRNRVEQDGSTREQLQEPSWKVLALGFASMVFFVVTVIVYTA